MYGMCCFSTYYVLVMFRRAVKECQPELIRIVIERVFIFITSDILPLQNGLFKYVA